MAESVKRRRPGRPPLSGNKKRESFDVYLTKPDKESWGRFAAQQDRSMSELAAELILERMREIAEPEAPPVRIFGYIHAGDAMTVSHLPPGTTARPPFALKPDCYGLIVIGDSMERDAGLSIPDGSYAFFCPELVAHHGAVVHVEWPLPDGSGEHECTLKRFCPNADGTVTFEPFNKRHKAITKKEGEYSIRGIFVRAWKGETSN